MRRRFRDLFRGPSGFWDDRDHKLMSDALDSVGRDLHKAWAERDALRDAGEVLAQELGRWGYGDFHYGATPRDPGVLSAIAQWRALVPAECSGAINCSAVDHVHGCFADDPCTHDGGG